jgi:hypothetical protein
MKILTGLMMSVSLLLTACGEFQTINKGSNEVLSSLSPYLSEADQKLAAELSNVYNEDISIRENLIDNKTIEIEIEGQVAQLEIINQGDIAFKFNGKNVYFDELANNSILESIISSSLIKVSSNTSLMSLMSAKKSQAFVGTLLSSVFGLVVKGIFNYAIVKVTEKAGEAVGGAVGTIGGSVIGDITGEPKPSKDEVKSAKDTIFGVILNALINKFTGGSQSTSNPADNSSNTSTQQPAQNCNLFCSLLGL